MKMRSSCILILTCGLYFPLSAQNLEDPTPGDVGSLGKLFESSGNFDFPKGKEFKKSNEVTVVLDPPPGLETKTSEDLQAKSATTDEPVSVKPTEGPILVTGKPPKDLAPEGTAQENGEAPGQIAEPSSPGLEVRVESVRKGIGQIDPKTVTLKASFPPKKLSSAPDGWVMEKAEGIPPMTREVELQPGTMVSLEISPHVLIPIADGNTIFAVSEPGFDGVEGYLQKQTVSAILSKSVLQLDEDAKNLGNAVSELHQILASLPKPEPVEEDLSEIPEKP